MQFTFERETRMNKTRQLSSQMSWAEATGLERSPSVVFGTADGIGLAVALSLAGAGARVACVDINPKVAQQAADRIRADGGDAIALVGDATDRLQVRAALAKVVEAWGGIERCVDVVGASPKTPIVDGDDDTWDLAMNLNLRQAYIVAGEVLPIMRKAGRGALCFVSSVAALTSMPNKAAYGASKAALVSLMKTLAVENGDSGIRVNAVAPGVTLTPAIKMRDAGAGGDVVRAHIPLARGCEPAEIANPITFLLSDLASYVTGQLLVVDGGSSSRYCLPVTNSGWADAKQMRQYFNLSQEERLEALRQRDAREKSAASAV